MCLINLISKDTYVFFFLLLFFFLFFFFLFCFLSRISCIISRFNREKDSETNEKETQICSNLLTSRMRYDVNR